LVGRVRNNMRAPFATIGGAGDTDPVQVAGHAHRSGEGLPCLVHQGLRVEVVLAVNVGQHQLVYASLGGGPRGVAGGGVGAAVGILPVCLGADGLVDQELRPLGRLH